MNAKFKAESRASEIRRREFAESRRIADQVYHDDSHRGLLDRLEELGIDPEELKTWLEGPRP
jgi:hypothetical protein